MEKIIKLAILVLGFFTFINVVGREDCNECDGTECDFCTLSRCKMRNDNMRDKAKDYGGKFLKKL